MNKREDLLQERLERLKAGAKLEACQRGMPEEDKALLSLVSRILSVEWPERDQKVVNLQRKRVIDLYIKEAGMKTENETRSGWFKNWKLPVVFTAGVVALLIFGLIIAIGVGSLLPSSRQVSSSPVPVVGEVDIESVEAEVKVVEEITDATESLLPGNALLADVHGLVQVKEGEEWVIAQPGGILTAGDHLHTGVLSSVTLQFKNGSEVRLGADSEISIDRLDINPDIRAREVVLTQLSGQSDHTVVSAETDDSRYEVKTPSASGLAQGTHFRVRVTPEQSSWYVDEGAVEVFGMDTSVVVEAGEMTAVKPDTEPEEPLVFFTGQGEVSYKNGVWVIAGQPYQTHERTVIIGNPQVGDIVFFEGHLLANETRVVDLIILIRRNPVNTFTLTGEVEVIEDFQWVVNGQTISITDTTEIDAGIVIGDLVRVEGIVLEGGTLLAEEIHRFEDEPGTPFDFTGVVQEMGFSSWLVSDVIISVNTDTVIEEGLEVGDLVRVQGWILDDDTWLASSITRVLDETRAFQFSGRIESMDPWVVAGISFEVRDWTDIEDGLSVGDLVWVEGLIQEGTWVAYKVERYDRAIVTILIGRVFSMDPWVVDGFELNVDDETVILGDITIGMLVRVEMQMLPDGNHKVLRIEPVKGFKWGLGCDFLIVTVLSFDENQIYLEGWPALPLDENVEIFGDLKPGSVVQIMVCFDEDMTLRVIYIIIIYQYQPELPPPGAGVEKVTICHKPNSKNPVTIVVAEPAVPAHLAHGDILGPCP